MKHPSNTTVDDRQDLGVTLFEQFFREQQQVMDDRLANPSQRRCTYVSHRLLENAAVIAVLCSDVVPNGGGFYVHHFVRTERFVEWLAERAGEADGQ
jgi:hypothetical protein